MTAAIVAMFVVGMIVGLLGGGGSILAMPLLVQLLGLEPRVAMAFSLGLVGLGALVGAVLNATRGHVDYVLACLFGAAGMGGAVLGSRLAPQVPVRVLLVGFVALMITTALMMKSPRRSADDDERPARGKLGKILVAAGLIGLMSGLVGAGGGFLVVPALTLLGGVEIRRAVGTSLAVLALQSTAGALASPSLRLVSPDLALPLVLASLWGTALGFSLSSRVPVAALRDAFANFVLFMACITAGKTLGAVAGVVATVSILASLAVLRHRGAATRP